MKAVYIVRGVVDYHVPQNTTVNICALDLSKAFDKMNHHGLFIKLEMRSVERGICPIAPLTLRLTLYLLTGSRV